MSDDRDDRFRKSADEESELQALEREKEAIENRPHDGSRTLPVLFDWNPRLNHWMSI